MAFSGTATSSATQSATSGAVNSGDLVNIRAGDPAQERWPGSVNPTDYADAGPDFAIEEPVSGSWMLSDFSGSVPEEVPGGGYQDTSWTTGTDGPMVPWDSNAGAPFAGSKAVNPDLHAEDTGAVYVAQHVAPAFIGRLTRRVTRGQTYNREYAFDATTGEYVPAPNGRTNIDQAQDWNPSPFDGGGYDPWQPGYAERPILNNVAYTVTPVTSVGTAQGVAGDLPDRSQFQAYQASTYEAPADPAVYPASTPATDSGSGWFLG
jgi:hypothetical protein